MGKEREPGARALDKTLFKGTGTGAKGLMNGFPPQTAPQKQNKLIVNPTQTQISVGFETLPLFLTETSEAAEHFQPLYHTQNISGK